MVVQPAQLATHGLGPGWSSLLPTVLHPDPINAKVLLIRSRVIFDVIVVVVIIVGATWYELPMAVSLDHMF